MRSVAFALSLSLIFIIPWEGVVQLPGFGTAAKTFGIVVAAFWLLTVSATRRMRTPSGFHFVLCVFVLWNAASMYWTTDVDNTLSRVMTWIQVCGFVFIVWDLYTTEARIYAGLQAYVAGAYVAVGSAAVTYISGGQAYYSTYERFSPSDSTNPDGFGLIIALGVPIACYLATAQVSGRVMKVFRLLNAVYIPVAFLGIALSGTRTAMIGTIPGILFGVASLARLRRESRVGVLVAGVAVVTLMAPQVSALKSFQRLGTTYGELTEGDLNYRTVIWGECLSSFLERPLLGVGANMSRSVNRVGKVAHNSFLSVLVEVGVIGLGLFASVLIIAIVHACQQTAWDKWFWLTFLFVWAIGASTLTYEHRKATWFLLSFVVASAAVPVRSKGARAASSLTTHRSG